MAPLFKCIKCTAYLVLFLWCHESVFQRNVFASPYPFKNKIQKDNAWLLKNNLKSFSELLPQQLSAVTTERVVGSPVLRVQLDWSEQSENFSLTHLIREYSGTLALQSNTQRKDPLGSYQATLTVQDSEGHKELFYQSLGTGKEYRKLVRALSFRFPYPKVENAWLEILGENPTSGIMEIVYSAALDLSKVQELTQQPAELRTLHSVPGPSKLVLNIYSESYLAERKEEFFRVATEAVGIISSFAVFKHLEMNAIFSPSLEKIGKALDLGLPVPEKKTLLGMFFPYWNKYGRWENVVYPTREKKMRDGFALAPYDYPLILVDDKAYFGAGNYKAFTAVPIQRGYFRYLLLHEFGHFFGLNEEYSGGGRTELEFAKNIVEPWSQNITFLKNPTELKWKYFVEPTTPLPTPVSFWNNPINPEKPYGAFLGGYADSSSIMNPAHIPGFSCIMEAQNGDYCQVCTAAIGEVIHRDLPQ